MKQTVSRPASVGRVRSRTRAGLGFARRAAAHFWRRRRWSLPAAAIFLAAIAAGFHPALADWRDALWIATASAAILLVIAYLALRTKTAIERLSAENAALGSALQAAERRSADLMKRATAESAARTALKAQFVALRARAARIDKRLARTQKLAARLPRLGAVLKRVEGDARKISGQLTKAEGADAQKTQRIGAIEARMSEFARLQNDTSSKTKMLETAAKRAAPNNASFYQSFNRQLDKAHIDQFTKIWKRRLSVDLTPATLGYMAERACHLEKQLRGRLASTIEDVMLRAIVAQSVKRKDLEILEIGALFGVGAGILYNALAPKFRSVHLTLLDPLDGYYAASTNDVLTGEPVSEEMLLRNFERAGVRREDFTLIKRMSAEPEALAEAARRAYDVLIIDGDHSYAGVKTDFENYAPLVRVGGYVIFDDYAVSDWPDVQKFVDDEMKSRDWLAHVGNEWRTSVYRVVKRPERNEEEGGEA